MVIKDAKNIWISYTVLSAIKNLEKSTNVKNLILGIIE